MPARWPIALWLAAAATLGAQPKKEEPVGLVMAAAGGRVFRAGAESGLAARPGDVLFSGDGLKTDSGPVRFVFCPSKSSQSLGPGGDVLLDTKQIKVRAGQLTDQKPMGSCFLPQVVRVSVASQQHYGVSMVRGLEEPKETPLTPPDKWPAELTTEMAAVDKAIAADPSDQSAVVARAALFEKYNLQANALAEYKKIATQWPDAVWVKGKLFELSASVAAAAAAPAPPAAGQGKTYALIAGISKYQRLPQEQWLQYADADARMFEKHMRSPRGGSVPPENIVVLTNEQATTSALRNAFQTFLKGRATKADAVFILIAGHGIVEVPGSKGAFILTYDSDPQDLPGTALPMAEVQKLFEDELAKVGRVALFVDVCHAGTIGSIKNETVNDNVKNLGDVQGDLLGLMASRPRELSQEGPQFGGGHGAFSYFVVKGLEGAADDDGNGRVDIDEEISYVTAEVPKRTNKNQHPREFGTYNGKAVLADVKQTGIDLAHAHFPLVYDSAGGPVYLTAAQAVPGVLSSEAKVALARLDDALEKRRYLPDQPDSAFAALGELKGKLSRQQYVLQENRLRVALEDGGQQVILRYLTGDQIPQTQQDFEKGATFYRTAQALTPESLFLEGRKIFCEGRSLLFSKKYPQAAGLLEQAVRIDPSGAHAYNALGIAYLEQADYARAIPAFRDAIKRAPHWAYPLHNLALSYAETGDYTSAIRSYEQAMKLTPQYSYLPYNLGLVYQRLNRRKDSEAAYRKAIALTPDLAEPYNALGSLKASTGHAQEAERLYRTALEKNPNLLAARHNLALLLSAKKERLGEAIDLWRDNLKRQSDYLPSRISLAAALPDPKEAIAEYRQILSARGDYVAARLALAALLEKTGDTTNAVSELQQVEPKNAIVYERIGDVESTAGRAADARSAYEKALEMAKDSETRKRIRRKLRQRLRL